jgi:hypothetical protein
MRMVMVHVVLTGRRFYFSTTRLAMISATILPKYYSAPKIPRKLGKLFI